MVSSASAVKATSAIVYEIGNDFQQHEACRIVVRDGVAVASNDHPLGALVVATPVPSRASGWKRTVAAGDGESFIRELPGAYCGSRLRVGLMGGGDGGIQDSAKSFTPQDAKYPGQPRDEMGRFGTGGGAPADSGSSGGSSNWSDEDEAAFSKYREWRDGQEGVAKKKISDALDSDRAKRLLTEDQRSHYSETAHGLIDGMPDDALQRFNANVDEVRFYPDQRSLSRAVYGPQASNHPGGCWAHELGNANGTLYLDGDSSGGSSAEHIYAHEFSHAIDGVSAGKTTFSGGRDRRLSVSSKWQDAWNSEVNPKSGDSTPLSEYAKKDSVEGFAEFGRLVLTQPAEAKSSFPGCWSAWQEFGLLPNDGDPEPWDKFRNKAFGKTVEMRESRSDSQRLVEIFVDSDQVGNIHVDLVESKSK